MSSEGLLLRHDGGPWRSPEVHTYRDEEMLKLMLRDSPQLLALCSEGSAFVDELTVPLIGSVDLAGVGPKGDITLVECKLGSNPEIRRSIVGQIFAYAAGLWKMPYEEFDRLFSARFTNLLSGLSLTDAVRRALPEQMAADWKAEEFRSNVADNLMTGRFTLVIAVDRITDELKRVVPYVNTHTVSDVRFIALEIGYAKDGDVEIIRPLTYGQESAEEKQPSQRRTWGVEAYFERLHEGSEAVQRFIHAVADFSKENGALLEGGSGLKPSLNARFQFGDERRAVWRSSFYSTGTSFELNFDYLTDMVPHEALRECQDILTSIDGVSERYAKLRPDFRACPTLPVDPILIQLGGSETVIRALNAVLHAPPSRGGALQTSTEAAMGISDR
jgi:hypothetical protein